MTKTDQILALVLGALALLWLGLALFVLLTRLLHDAGALIVQAARGLVAPGLSDALAGEAVDLAPLLRRLSGRTIERYAADTGTPDLVAAALAKHVLSLYPERIISLARSSNARRVGERIVALRVLARARWFIALPLLEQALRSGEEQVVAAAVVTLGELPDRRAAEILVHGLRDRVFAQSRIAAQLDRASTPIGDLIVPLLHEIDPRLRFWGATLLGRYAGATGVDVELAAATGDTDESVRAAAIESLSAGRGPAGIAAALALLEDPVWFVRAHAARAIRAYERADLTEAVAPLLADEAWWVRSAAKQTLESQPAAALDALVSYLDHRDRFARNGAAEVIQNTGTLDELLVRAVETGSDADLSLLERILSAGGTQLGETAAARGGGEAKVLIGHLASASG